MSCVLMHKKELELITGCFTSEPIPPQSPCTHTTDLENKQKV